MSRDETWRDIGTHVGFYEVSDLGRVRSIKRRIFVEPSVQCSTGHYRSVRERVLRPGVDDSGRHSVYLRRDGTLRQARVYRLVLEAFVGPCPEGCEGCHDDGNVKNNRLSNLYWGTPAQNNADKKRHGTHLEGEAIPWAKLTEKDVRRIRKLAERLSQQALADEHGVSQSQISRIIRRKEWRHV